MSRYPATAGKDQSPMLWPGVMGIGSQVFNFVFAIAFVVVTHVNAFHVKRAVVDLVSQGTFEQVFDFQVFDHAALHG